MREVEPSLEAEVNPENTEIIENQARKFLATLATHERRNLPRAEYQLHMPEVEIMAKRIISEKVGQDAASRDQHDERIQEMRKSIVEILSPMYENNQLIGFPDDEIYLAKNQKYHEALKGYLQLGAREDVIPTEHASARLGIEKIAAEMERTPRGKLLQLYALLNREVGKE